MREKRSKARVSHLLAENCFHAWGCTQRNLGPLDTIKRVLFPLLSSYHFWLNLILLPQLQKQMSSKVRVLPLPKFIKTFHPSWADQLLFFRSPYSKDHRRTFATSELYLYAGKLSLNLYVHLAPRFSGVMGLWSHWASVISLFDSKPASSKRGHLAWHWYPIIWSSFEKRFLSVSHLAPKHPTEGNPCWEGGSTRGG